MTDTDVKDRDANRTQGSSVGTAAFEEMPRIPSVSDVKAEPVIEEEDGGVHEDDMHDDALDAVKLEREVEQHGANQYGVGKS